MAYMFEPVWPRGDLAGDPKWGWEGEKAVLILLFLFDASRLAGSERSAKKLELDSGSLRCRFGNGLFAVYSF